MNATQEKLSNILASDGARKFLVNFICTIFISIFFYTVSVELFSTNTFFQFIRKFKFLNSSVLIVTSYVPFAELIISGLLLFWRTKLAGLVASAIVVIASTIYLGYMRLTSDHLPCHCGFTISRLSWVEQIWFNMLLIILAGVGIFLMIKLKRDKDLNDEDDSNEAHNAGI